MHLLFATVKSTWTKEVLNGVNILVGCNRFFLSGAYGHNLCGHLQFLGWAGVMPPAPMRWFACKPVL